MLLPHTYLYRVRLYRAGINLSLKIRQRFPNNISVLPGAGDTNLNRDPVRIYSVFAGSVKLPGSTNSFHNFDSRGQIMLGKIDDKTRSTSNH